MTAVQPDLAHDCLGLDRLLSVELAWRGRVRGFVDERKGQLVAPHSGRLKDAGTLRHADNLDSVRTYEGTDETHTPIMGRSITGIAAVASGAS